MATTATQRSPLAAGSSALRADKKALYLAATQGLAGSSG